MRVPTAITLLVVGTSLGSCISSLPDDPVELPDGPVQGLRAVYITEAESHTIAFADILPEEWFVPRETYLEVGTTTVAIDSLYGIFIGELDSFDRLDITSHLSVPGITILEVNPLLQLQFDNYGDRVVGELLGQNNFRELARESDVAMPRVQVPQAADLDRVEGILDRPSGLVSESYFECVDESRGRVGSWEIATLNTPPCLTSLFR